MTRTSSSVRLFAAVSFFIESVLLLLKKEAVVIHGSSCCLIGSFRGESEGLFNYLMSFTHISNNIAFDFTEKGILFILKSREMITRKPQLPQSDAYMILNRSA